MKTFEKMKVRTLRAATQPGSHASPIAVPLGPGLLLYLIVGIISVQPATAQMTAPLPTSDLAAALSARVHSPSTAISLPAKSTHPLRANFAQEAASPAAREMADWVIDSADNRSKPFVIVDKIQAKVFVFDALGQLRGAAPVLLGLAVGDDSVPGIGQRKLSSIRPEERTTPAGRFVASLDRNLQGEEILWVDYDAAISMHRVITSNPKERRAQRLDSSSLADRRISYGCINLPVQFYNKVLSPSFTGTDGIVYVLPETRSVREVFGSYVVGESAPLQPVAISLTSQGAQ